MYNAKTGKHFGIISVAIDFTIAPQLPVSQGLLIIEDSRS
jgi:hypothetical protein